MSEWTDKTAHQAEMELLDAEKEGRDKSFFLGEADFRGNLDEDPSRHNLVNLNASEYRIGWQSEAKFQRNMESIRANRPAQAEAERQVLKSMALHTEDVIRKLKLPTQRYHVWHYNSMSVWLNKDAPGFATYDAARLDVDRLLAESTTLPGDSVVLEDKGVTLAVYTKEVEPMTASEVAANPPTSEGLRAAQEAFIEPIVAKALELLERKGK